jgi:NADPH:quinone reductase-like Zn-dependent oxidoreductase
MRAARFHEYGDPEVLVIEEVPIPTPGTGEVLVTVRAAGVNPVDWKIRRGARGVPLPAGLGSDVAGVVDAVGAGVTEVSVGDEVFGVSTTPSYAEFALAKPSQLARKPAAVPWEVAGAIGVAGRTAYRVLRELEVESGDTVLVHPAAGGVGLFAVQLAVRAGASVIGTGSEGNHEFIRSIGATPVAYGEGLVERVRAAAPKGIDAVLDSSGRGELPLLVDLAGGGRRVISVADLDASRYGASFSGSSTSPTDVSGAFPLFARLLEAGELTVPIWNEYPLEQVAAAHAESELGHLRGKIVLTVST